MPKKTISPDYDGSTELDNPKWELFCQLYCRKYFGNATAAYRDAGYDSENADVNGCRLLGNDRIQLRIKHLRNEYMKTIAIDAAKIMDMRLAIATDPAAPHSAKVAAIKDIEKALGLEKATKIETTGSVSVSMTPAEAMQHLLEKIKENG